MKIAIYARVSTQDQDADKQVEICQKECEKREMEVYHIYKETISVQQLLDQYLINYCRIWLCLISRLCLISL